jgi:subtilisin family serine protease
MKLKQKTQIVLDIKLVCLLIIFSALTAVVATKVQAAKPLTGRYIVVLKDNVTDTRGVANDHAKKKGAKVSNVYTKALKGYAAQIPANKLNELQRDSRVAYVEADGIATKQAVKSWGLDRIDQRALPLNNLYNPTADGSGVKAYIIDTGINKAHTDFGGRVTDGFDAVDNSLPANDCNGHGTHVAGTTGGATYGVAKNVSLVSVRVLDCTGSGYWSWVIAGIDYVTGVHQTGQPAVANLSLSGGANLTVDNAVKRSIAKGVSYSVAAGNSSRDACVYSPARVPAAITVSATDKVDAKPTWANWGNCVDWFAPGYAVTSAWHSSNTAAKTISGTSMASPHVAGAAALYLQKNPTATPQQVRDYLYGLTTKNVVKKSNTARRHLLFSNL